MKKLTVIAIAALLAIPLTGTTATDFLGHGDNSEMIEVGKKAPGFDLPGVAGVNRSLDDFKGHYIVLEWVNLDCPVVADYYEEGTVQDVQASLKSDGVIWLSICSAKPGQEGFYSGKDLRARLAAIGSQASDYLQDSYSKVANKYGTDTAPTTFLIRPDGRIIYAGAFDDAGKTSTSGARKQANHLQTAYEADRAGRKVEVTSTAPYGCEIEK